MYDRPGAVAVHKIAKFETIIIAINYKGSGKDKVLGSFSWGWRSNGRIRLHTGNGVQLNKTITPTSRRIIKYDYPSYQLP